MRPSVLALLQWLPQTAGFVMSATCEALAWNDLAAALMEDFAPLAPEDRNLARHIVRHNVGNDQGLIKFLERLSRL